MMDHSTIALLVALAIGFGAAAVFEGMRLRALRPYWSRSCQGRAWMRAFPEATASEIRTFLGVLAASFGFRPAQCLSFSPADALLNIYRACYPVESWPDALELETFDRAVKVRYGIELRAVWSESLTLGEVFECGLTTRCSRRRAAGAGWIHRGHAPAAAEPER